MVMSFYLLFIRTGRRYRGPKKPPPKLAVHSPNLGRVLRRVWDPWQVARTSSVPFVLRPEFHFHPFAIWTYANEPLSALSCGSEKFGSYRPSFSGTWKGETRRDPIHYTTLLSDFTRELRFKTDIYTVKKSQKMYGQATNSVCYFLQVTITLN